MAIRRDRLSVLRAGWSLGLGFASLSVFIAAAVILYVQQQSSDAVVRRALQTELALANVFSGLQDAEIGQRGYLLTGDTSFLQPYHTGGERLDKQMAGLAKLTGSTERLVQPFATLQRLAATKRAEMAQSIALFQANRADDATALVRGGSGKQIMDDIRQVIAAMDAREDETVETREAALRREGVLVAASITAAVLLLGLVTLAAMREVLRRSQLARFLPAEVAGRLAEGDLSLREGRELPAAVVFIDIRNSTALAEQIPVAALSQLLSRFRSDVLAAAEAEGGLVDKFIGDGALVVFGVHDPTATSAVQALRFARDLRGRHATTREGSAAPPYDIGIGVHYGMAFCGIVGTSGRLEFTVLGDTVNVAARLEKETKVHGVDLLVSDAVLREANEPAEHWRELGCDVLRGRRAPITLFAEQVPPEISRPAQAVV